MSWPDAGVIRARYTALAGGGSLTAVGEHDLSIGLACARRLGGMGVDHSDPDGAEARRRVDEALVPDASQ